MNPARSTISLLSAIALAFALILQAGAQSTDQPKLPNEFTERDIGAVTAPGDTAVDANNVWTLKGDGSGITGTADAFHFASRAFKGNGSMVARITGLQGGDPALARFGPMIRATDAAGSENVFLPVTGGQSLLFQYRPQADQGTVSANLVLPPDKLPASLRLQRVNNDFAAFVSDDNRIWRAVGVVRTIPMPETALFGLALTSGKAGELATGTASNVEVQPNVFSIFGLNACVGENGVLLQWRPLTSDVVGFNVFRGAVGATFDTFQRLTPTPITTTSFPFTSTNLALDQPVVFLVQSVTRDSAGKLVEGPLVAIQATPVRVPQGFQVCSISEGVSLGSLVVDPATGAITLRGTGGSIGADADRLFFTFRPIQGDARITATLPSLPSLTSENATAGLMLRESLEPNARYVALLTTPNGLVLQARKTAGTEVELVNTTVLSTLPLPPISLRLVREKNTISATISRDGGQTFVRVGDSIAFAPDLPQTMYGGLAVTGDTAKVSEARFTNVVVLTP